MSVLSVSIYSNAHMQKALSKWLLDKKWNTCNITFTQSYNLKRQTLFSPRFRDKEIEAHRGSINWAKSLRE